jgi:hypothetical protein
MEEGVPVSVTLIKPAGFHTLFVEHARNHLQFQPKLSAPVYAPDVVAKAILHAAQNPQRDVFVGAASRAMSGCAHQTPSLFDRVTSLIGVVSQKTDEPPSDAADAWGTAAACRKSPRQARALESSAYPSATLHKYPTLGIALGVGVLCLMLGAAQRERDDQ